MRVEWLSRALAPVRLFAASSFSGLATLNEWLAEKFKTTQRRVLAVEIGSLVGVGFVMMQIGEHLIAIALWILLAVLWISKICLAELNPSHRGLAIVERTMHGIVPYLFALFWSLSPTFIAAMTSGRMLKSYGSAAQCIGTCSRKMN